MRNKGNLKENKMRLRTKMAIFMAAALLTFVGFSLIASPAVDMVKVGNDAGFEIITNWQAQQGAAAHQANTVKG
jgi:hypothetical protein